jgi:hypothetical protein
MKSIIVMTTIGDVPPHLQSALDEILPAPPGFCWRFVPEASLAIQFRSILRIDPRAVAVWVGQDDAVNRAAKLISGLLQAGVRVVIAIAEMHDARTESVLRQAGALYFCANEAQQRLGQVLNAILGPPSGSTDFKTVEPKQEVKMDAS